jgi:hypothetical protein
MSNLACTHCTVGRIKEFANLSASNAQLTKYGDQRLLLPF